MKRLNSNHHKHHQEQYCCTAALDLCFMISVFLVLLHIYVYYVYCTCLSCSVWIWIVSRAPDWDITLMGCAVMVVLSLFNNHGHGGRYKHASAHIGT